MCGFRANSVVLKMLIHARGNLLCFAVELGFFLKYHPMPFTTTVVTRPATVEYKPLRFSTDVAPARPTGVVWSCVWCLRRIGSENGFDLYEI